MKPITFLYGLLATAVTGCVSQDQKDSWQTETTARERQERIEAIQTAQRDLIDGVICRRGPTEYYNLNRIQTDICYDFKNNLQTERKFYRSDMAFDRIPFSALTGDYKKEVDSLGRRRRFLLDSIKTATPAPN